MGRRKGTLNQLGMHFNLPEYHSNSSTSGWSRYSLNYSAVASLPRRPDTNLWESWGRQLTPDLRFGVIVLFFSMDVAIFCLSNWS
jgi:hypothetical protein